MRVPGVIIAALLLAGCATPAATPAKLETALDTAAKTEFTLVQGAREAFPQWSATDLDGYPWSSTNLPHRYTVINFWASWCQPCVDEWPELQAAAAGHPSVTFIGVNSLDELPSARRFLKEHASDYRHLADPSAALLKSLTSVPNSNMPTTIVLDPAHAIAAWKVGPVSKGQLRRVLQALLAAAKAA